MMTMTQGSIIDLDDPSCSDPQLVGVKAAELARLRAGGFPVPSGVVLPASLLAGWSPGEPCTTVVREAVESALSRLREGPVAVRSSADAEDGTAASYAGAYATVLGAVGIRAVTEAVRTSLDSADAPRLTAYRGEARVRMSVLLQPMLVPSAAGVAFTADPVTGQTDVVVISAVAGLGDQVADGTADPEEWRVSVDGSVRSRDDRPPVLTPRQAEAVAGVARNLAASLGGHQDVEWAMVEGRTWVLQSRPITTLPTRPTETLQGLGWAKDLGHFPELVTPFGWSIFGPSIVDAGMRMGTDFGLMMNGLEQVSIGGEIYVRPIPPIGPPEPSDKVPPPLVVGFVARVIPKLRRRMKTARRVLTEGLPDRLIEKWEQEWRTEFTERTRQLLAEELASLDGRAFVDHLQRARRLLEDGHTVHFQLLVPYSLAMYELVTTCEDLLGWDVHQSMRLLIGSSPASVAGVASLTDLRRQVAQRGELADALRRSPADPVAALESVDPAVAEMFRSWLQTHAWRTTNYDPGAVAVAERPGVVTRLLLQTGNRTNEESARTAEDEAIARLAGSDVERFRSALARARRAYPVREDNVILTDNIPCGILRRWVLEAGRRLVERGLLGRVDDVVYCAADELERALPSVSGEPGMPLQPIVARRRGEQAWVRAHPGPTVVGTTGSMPSLRFLPEHGRHINEAMLWALSMEFPGEVPSTDGELGGIPASPGLYTGRVRIVKGESDFATFLPGEVLACPTASPSWTVLFGVAGAVVTDGGGPLAHASIVAREHGLPAVVGVNATGRLRNGQLVTVDGTAGAVTIHDEID